MANIYKGALGLIGNTPLVELTHIERHLILKQKFLQNLSISIRQEVLRTE